MKEARQVAVNFFIALVVFGNGRKTLLGSISEIDPNAGLNTLQLTPFYELHVSGCIVDVSEAKLCNTIGYCQGHELFRANGAIFQTIVAMTVQVHVLFFKSDGADFVH